LARCRIDGLDLVVLVVVASLARQCEVVLRGFAAVNASDRVFDGIRVWSKTLLTATVLTAAMGAPVDLATQ
jgi:hypothetical protein